LQNGIEVKFFKEQNSIWKKKKSLPLKMLNKDELEAT
jgi:hypothetical protein